MGVMANARGFAADNRIRVFVAAARPDVSFADQIGAFLHNEGFQPLLDRYESGGEGWQDRLGRLIEDADALVLVLTEASAHSDQCVWEVEEAQRLGKRVVLVLPSPLRGVSREGDSITEQLQRLADEGLVTLGTTHSAISPVPVASVRFNQGMWPLPTAWPR